MIRPAIIVGARSQKVLTQQTEQLMQILAGIEEEGVLFQTYILNTPTNFYELGESLSQQSQLEVAIALDEIKAGFFILKLGEKCFQETSSDYRTLGQNAARYVKGNALKNLRGEDA
jgi:hypothetical protein